jgi:hypothetical protein
MLPVLQCKTSLYQLFHILPTVCCIKQSLLRHATAINNRTSVDEDVYSLGHRDKCDFLLFQSVCLKEPKKTKNGSMSYGGPTKTFLPSRKLTFCDSETLLKIRFLDT